MGLKKGLKKFGKKVGGYKEKYDKYQTESREKRIQQYGRRTEEAKSKATFEEARARTRKAQTSHRPKSNMNYGNPFAASPFSGGTTTKPRKKRRKKKRKAMIVYR